MIFDFHSFHARKLPSDAIVVEDSETELDIREDDIGRASNNQIYGLAVVLPGFDHTGGKPTPDPVRLDDEAATMAVGQSGERNLVRSPLPDEDLATLIGACGPSPGQFEGAGIP